MDAKFKAILNNFLKEDCCVNEVYVNKLITHLSEKDNNFLLHSTFVLDWIDEYLENHSKDDNKTINKYVASFMLNLSALIIDNEWLLVPARERKIPDKILTFLEKNKETLTPSMKLGHVHFIASVAKYSFGLVWIKTKNAWRDIMNYCEKSQIIYVEREAKTLLYNILYKFLINANDEEMCNEIITEILKPLNENVFNEMANTTIYVDDLNLQRTLSPTLNLICFILEKSIESDIKIKFPHYFDLKNLEMNLWRLSDMTQNEQFLGEIFKTQTYYNYSKLIYDKWNGPGHCMESEEFNQFGVNFFNLMKFCIARKSGLNVLKMAELNHILWKKLGQRAPEEILIENERIQFENQLIIFFLLPVIFIFRNRISNTTELFDNYLMKLFCISCEYTLRLCYSFRDILDENPAFSADLAYKSIHGILTVQHQLHKDRAILLFQAMMYYLKEYAPDSFFDDPVYTDTNVIVKSPNLLSAVLVGLHTLIKEYRITWNESIESTCLLNFMIIALRNSKLTPTLAVQCIKLTKLSIEHFLSPNLALLVDNLDGTGMQWLGPMISKRLHDISWEVRDSTLELVSTITCISRLKFPAFQEYLLNNQICPIVFSIAQNESEPYVKASALKCLSEMCAINLLWDKCLYHYQMVDILLKMLLNETEGIVRKEGVTLITQIHNIRGINELSRNQLYSTLSYLTINDLHWEVRVYCLYFWKFVVCHEFSNQGMIDGVFPTITFSKEKRKIITLTEKEILIRIEAILNKLSDVGCLGVMLTGLKSDSDLAVLEVGVALTKCLLNYLNKYNYLDCIENERKSETTNDNNEILNNDITEQNSNTYIEDLKTPETLNSIIESILDTDDNDLLIESYKNKLNMKDNDQWEDDDVPDRKIDENYYKKYILKNPNVFLCEIKSMELDLMIEKKKVWLTNNESLESLIDDILCSININDINATDCY